VFPLTAYCEHPQCLRDSFYTYRYYLVDGQECPALYFDPLIIVGGDREKNDPKEPNYCTRCDQHHVLPAKEYTFLTLKPLGVEASKGNPQPLMEELSLVRSDIERSALYASFLEHYGPDADLHLNALKVPCIAERALVYLFVEENLISEALLRRVVTELDLDVEYLERRLADNRRAIRLSDSADRPGG
jgi:thymidine kinase